MALFPWLTQLCFLAPISVGLLGTLLPSLGYLPALGEFGFHLDAWRALAEHPSTASAIGISLRTGLFASGLSLLITLGILISCYQTRLWELLRRSLPAMLATPHAAFAIGLVFLVLPSGWLLRLFSPWLTGFAYPPNQSWPLIQGEAVLVLVLCLKEVPFLLLMSLGLISQHKVDKLLLTSQSLGYSRFKSWVNVVLPVLWPSLRLPFYAISAYSLSTVELALIAGPSTPPTFAVLINRFFNDPELSYRLMGSAAAISLLLMVLLVLFGLYLIERLIGRLSERGRLNGQRQLPLEWLWQRSAQLLVTTLWVFSLLSVMVLVIWSFTRSWRFPEALPSTWSTQTWQKSLQALSQPIEQTLLIGVVSVLLSACLVIGCLEYETYRQEQGRPVNPLSLQLLVYTPLLVPQIAFIFGLQTGYVWLGLGGHWLGVACAHVLFVLPYVYLSLSDTYRRFDERYTLQALSLQPSRFRALWQVKLPILRAPLLFSLATGFAVSVAQYLPTLYIGAGRVSTVTTETLALASGSDRRVIAAYALVQCLLPLLVYITVIVCTRRERRFS